MEPEFAMNVLCNGADSLQGVNTQVQFNWFIDMDGKLQNWMTYFLDIETVNGLFFPALEAGTYEVALVLATDSYVWNLDGWDMYEGYFMHGNHIEVANCMENLCDIDDIKDQLDTWEPVILSMSDDVATIKTDVGEVKVTLNELEPEIVGVKDELVEINSNIGIMWSSISGINGYIRSIDQNVAEIETSIGILRGTVSMVQDDVFMLMTDVGTLKVNVDQLKADVASVKSEVLATKSEATAAKWEAEGAKSAAESASANALNALYKADSLTPLLYVAILFSALAFIVAVLCIIQLSRKIA
jgi:archaellum component FlaC